VRLAWIADPDWKCGQLSTPEAVAKRFEGHRKRITNMTPEKRSEIARKIKAKMTAEQRSEIARKRDEKKTPEQRSRNICLWMLGLGGSIWMIAAMLVGSHAIDDHNLPFVIALPVFLPPL
jgi:hypothetical protein